ncbi:pH-response regulator protein palC [Metarhizium album ARSEF 1941]|uniref:pH-response regulator protein palC n=1 Tax=Metarhizium album (strain ARSEF 1941) TaxID=1081103 RepID=A0A0B2WWM6_METAS|nr:pH-response regulator protein palC [Metarhizium album ARSEF 1941]KHO00627.1 pH-response regulator protein palC [Metarhizium album ARSEF 1941]
MPFPFVLPTTSAFSFSSCFSCDSHPSLPLTTSGRRGVVRDALKKHKRSPPNARIGSLATVVSSIDGYLPYLLAVDAGVSSQCLDGGEVISVVLKTAPSIGWRPTLSGDIVPGRERSRIKITSLEYEIFFVLSSLAYAYTLTARSTLHPLYTTTTDFLGIKERTTAVTTATKYLLDAASLYDYLSLRSEQISSTAPCADVAPTTARALSSLALAEATLLAVLKDDPYPAAVAQGRNETDKEWMFKAPDIPKVRAHLFARLCLAASEHAAEAASLLQSAGSGTNKVNPVLLKYLEHLRRTSRAKACRFFGIDAELGGQTAEGIGWLRVGLQELGVEVKAAKQLSFGLSRLKKDMTEKREDRRVERETDWGSDAGRLEETRIIELLDKKWNKINDTMNTRAIPPPSTLLPKMPSGREIYTVKPYQPPTLDRHVLEAMRSPPDREDDLAGDLSSDDDASGPSAPSGAFPGTSAEYGVNRSGSGSGNAYY